MQKIDRNALTQSQVAGGCCKCSCKKPSAPPAPTPPSGGCNGKGGNGGL